MRRLGVASVLATATVAGAQPPEPKLLLDVGLVAGIPRGDFDDFDAETSPGLHLQGGYLVAQNIGIVVGARYFLVRSQFADDNDVDIVNWDLDVGGRYQLPVSPTLDVFGEAILIYSTLDVSGPGGSVDGSGIGFGARAGAMFDVSPRIGLGGAASVTAARVDIETGTGSGKGDAVWVGLEGFVSFGF